MANSIQHMPKQNLTHTFLHKAHHSLLVLKNTRRHFSTMHGSPFNSKITNKKHKDAKNVALNRLPKGHVFTLGELKQEGSVASFALS